MVSGINSLSKVSETATCDAYGNMYTQFEVSGLGRVRKVATGKGFKHKGFHRTNHPFTFSLVIPFEARLRRCRANFTALVDSHDKHGPKIVPKRSHHGTHRPIAWPF